MKISAQNPMREGQHQLSERTLAPNTAGSVFEQQHPLISALSMMIYAPFQLRSSSLSPLSFLPFCHRSQNSGGGRRLGQGKRPSLPASISLFHTVVLWPNIFVHHAFNLQPHPTSHPPFLSLSCCHRPTNRRPQLRPRLVLLLLRR